MNSHKIQAHFNKSKTIGIVEFKRFLQKKIPIRRQSLNKRLQESLNY